MENILRPQDYFQEARQCEEEAILQTKKLRVASFFKIYLKLRENFPQFEEGPLLNWVRCIDKNAEHEFFKKLQNIDIDFNPNELKNEITLPLVKGWYDTEEDNQDLFKENERTNISPQSQTNPPSSPRLASIQDSSRRNSKVADQSDQLSPWKTDSFLGKDITKHLNMNSLDHMASILHDNAPDADAPLEIPSSPPLPFAGEEIPNSVMLTAADPSHPNSRHTHTTHQQPFHYENIHNISSIPIEVGRDAALLDSGFNFLPPSQQVKPLQAHFLCDVSSVPVTVIDDLSMPSEPNFEQLHQQEISIQQEKSIICISDDTHFSKIVPPTLIDEIPDPSPIIKAPKLEAPIEKPTSRGESSDNIHKLERTVIKSTSVTRTLATPVSPSRKIRKVSTRQTRQRLNSEHKSTIAASSKQPVTTRSKSISSKSSRGDYLSHIAPELLNEYGPIIPSEFFVEKSRAEKSQFELSASALSPNIPNGDELASYMQINPRMLARSNFTEERIATTLRMLADSQQPRSTDRPGMPMTSPAKPRKERLTPAVAKRLSWIKETDSELHPDVRKKFLAPAQPSTNEVKKYKHQMDLITVNKFQTYQKK